ncbi:MAG TPA: HAD-IB family phosphatase [Pyrinomonadaceae bacterium]|nr:HAD-IB family phosphatase [Pyrinomonadaceae bacterium]
MAEELRDVFICHASQDKHDIVKPLVEAFTRAQISCWLDEAEIKWGDSIIQKVNEGLSTSRYVIVVLSSAFISKNWPQRELNSMLNIEASSGEVKVLPLLVGTDEEKRVILQKLPLLNDKLYLAWADNAGEIAHNLLIRLSKNVLSEPEKSGVATARISTISSLAQREYIPSVNFKPPDWLRYKLIAFDLDGTLLRGCTFSWTLVWDYLGYEKKLQKAGMRRYREGKTTYKQWCEWACKLFTDKNLKREDFKQITQNLRLTKNFYETLKILKNEGLILAIISGGIDTFIEEKIPDANKWFDYIFINKLIFDNFGRLNGVVATDYDFAGKAKALQLICEANGLKIEESVFVGEGFNDEDAACAAGLCIAYPPVAQGLDVVADVCIEEDNLSLIIPHVLTR